jgi:ankyrin repeat protein
MAEYLLSAKNYEKLLLTDTNINTDFIPKYISGLNHPGFTRYSISKNRKYTIRKSYLYKQLEGRKINTKNAVIEGRLEIIKYLYIISLKNVLQNIKHANVIINEASGNGHLETIKYFYSLGKTEASQNGINWAASGGHLKIIKYLYNKTYKYDIERTEDGIDLAAEEGHLEVVKYLYSQGVKGSNYGIDLAAINDDLRVVKYLYSQGVKGTKYGVDYSSRYGHLEVVKYLYSIGLEGNVIAVNWAAGYGHLEVVKYLYSKGLKATNWSLNTIAENMSLSIKLKDNILSYLHNNGINEIENDHDWMSESDF